MPTHEIGAIAPNLHEGSRSEYLAQFVFSGFGTSIPVPHQEDTGLDLYCTLVERIGRRAWPRAYYCVQVKSTLEPWVFASVESVRWLIEHPLPIFLCVVQKTEARLLVYHTSPRFVAWVTHQCPQRLELIPGTESEARPPTWMGEACELKAPILNFTIPQFLDPTFRDQVREVLQHWINFDVDNLFRIRCGIPRFLVPATYKTNSIEHAGLVWAGEDFRDDLLATSELRLKELLGVIATHYFRKGDLATAAVYAMTLRQLSPEPVIGGLDPHDSSLHFELNCRFGLPGGGAYVYEACDSLLKSVREQLARHGV